MVDRNMPKKPKAIAVKIRDLAARHGVVYTCLLGDDAALDHIEQLLIALRRSGYLNNNATLLLEIEYFQEKQGLTK